MKKIIVAKLKNNKGETLMEALTAIMIISLTFAFLCNTINTANKINFNTKKEHPEMTYSGASAYTTSQVFVNRTKNTYSNDSSIHSGRTVTVYKDVSGNYLYY